MKIKYFNYGMCKSCGGKCCSHHSGCYIPADFNNEITVDFIKTLLNSGEYAMDWWDGDVRGLGLLDRTFYIRPRHIDEEIIVGSWGGKCVHLSFNGCLLSESDRPYQCRKLVPKISEESTCQYLPEDDADKKSCISSWYPYQDVLQAIFKTEHLFDFVF